MNPLTNIRNLQKVNELELKLGLVGKKSWHDKYKDSAWIFLGGLPFDLTEGDVVCVFSQYGEIVNINLVRDKKTGKFKGYGFLCFEDQRSTILSVDNLNGAKILGRTMRVDHVENYKQPKEFGDEDDVTKQLRSDGCAPKLSEPESEEDEDDYVAPVKKVKKEKKSKKKKKEKKKKNKKSESSDGSDSPRIKTEKYDQSYQNSYNRERNAGTLKHSSDNVKLERISKKQTLQQDSDADSRKYKKYNFDKSRDQFDRDSDQSRDRFDRDSDKSRDRFDRDSDKSRDRYDRHSESGSYNKNYDRYPDYKQKYERKHDQPSHRKDDISYQQSRDYFEMRRDRSRSPRRQDEDKMHDRPRDRSRSPQRKRRSRDRS